MRRYARLDPPKVGEPGMGAAAAVPEMMSQPFGYEGA
jgi:hypothetical protein